jgi:hypothetical protein
MHPAEPLLEKREKGCTPACLDMGRPFTSGIIRIFVYSVKEESFCFNTKNRIC